MSARSGYGGSCAAAVALLLVTVCCQPASTGRMVAVAPPDGWERELGEARAAKDEGFAANPDSPLLEQDRAGFDGLEYWPPDPSFRFVGPIHLHPQPQRVTMPTTVGTLRPAENHGWLSFVRDGTVHVLQVYRLLDAPPGDDELFLPFTDETTGRETYPAGRYVDLLPDGEERWVLDFNRAKNPFCAYGAPERYSCPVAPPANRLPLRVEAGERGFKLPGDAGGSG